MYALPPTIMFTAPNLPDGEFMGEIAVSVTSMNIIDGGPTSDNQTAVISKSYFV